MNRLRLTIFLKLISLVFIVFCGILSAFIYLDIRGALLQPQPNILEISIYILSDIISLCVFFGLWTRSKWAAWTLVAYFIGAMGYLLLGPFFQGEAFQRPGAYFFSHLISFVLFLILNRFDQDPVLVPNKMFITCLKGTTITLIAISVLLSAPIYRQYLANKKMVSDWQAERDRIATSYPFGGWMTTKSGCFPVYKVGNKFVRLPQLKVRFDRHKLENRVLLFLGLVPNALKMTPLYYDNNFFK